MNILLLWPLKHDDLVITKKHGKEATTEVTVASSNAIERLNTETIWVSFNSITYFSLKQADLQLSL